MSRSEEVHGKCVDTIRAAISQIAHEGREPDLWERVHLVSAISMLFRGAYSLGAFDAEKAMAPIDQRSAKPNLPADPFFDRCDLALLAAALLAAEAEPVRQNPHFGPIILDQQERQ